MQRDKNQVLMFSQAELDLIKTVFADNDELLYAIRSVLLQLPMTAAQYDMLKVQMTPAVYAVVKKRLFPDLDPEAPLTQLGDIYQTLTPDLRVKSVEDMRPLFEAKQLEIEYLTQQFAALKGEEVEQVIKLEDLAVLFGKNDETRYIHTTARNFLLGYIDPMLMNFKVIAGEKTETPAEQAERLTRNSTK